MRSEDVCDLMRWTAAGWAHDELKPMASSIANKAEMLKACDPGYWELRQIGDHTMTTHRRALATCMINYEGDKLHVEVGIDIHMGIGWVVKASLVRERLEYDRPFDVGKNAFITAKDKYLEERAHTLKKAVDWYTKKFNPVLDTDIGTLDTDWELFDHYRPAIESQCHSWIWLRVSNRSEHHYDANFIDPGRVIVETSPGLETTVSWISRPRNDWVMAPDPTKPEPAGFGSWQ